MAYSIFVTNVVKHVVKGEKWACSTLKVGGEQAHYVYHENARFQEILRGNKRKSEVRLNLRFWYGYS